MGWSFEKLLIIGALAMFLIGPERLPHYAAQLGRLVRTSRRWLDDAKGRVREELGEDFDEEQWKKLDPRQYDPRRIIRDALLEPVESSTPVPVHVEQPRAIRLDPSSPAVYDTEAT